MDNLFLQLGRVGPKLAVGTFLLLLALESAFPLRRRTRPRPGRWFSNFFMTAVAFVTGTYVVKAASMRLSFWTEQSGFGLLHTVPLGPPARFALGFLLMDLTFYYWHRMNHEIPLLWRFHNVHHVDPDVDVTTSFRFHFVEVLYSTGFRAVQVGLIGVSPVTYAIYEIAFTCETAFHHSNLRIPIRAERLINNIIVTPRMHGIHHSTVKAETNSNYSVIFRVWDLLHGTLHLGVKQEDVTIGVPAYLGPGDNGLMRLLALPFTRQREYWRYTDGGMPERAPAGSFNYTRTLTE